MTASEAVRAALSAPEAKSHEPMDIARCYRATRRELEGEPTLARWARAWWRYDGVRYVEHDDEALDRELLGFLDEVKGWTLKKGKKGEEPTPELKRVTARRSTLAELRSALLRVMPLLEGGAPQWTRAEDGDRDARHLVPCRNGLLDIRADELVEPTPRYFATTCLGVEWSTSAPAPTAWLAFLDTVWPKDPDSIRLLQQVMGYLLSGDTNQHKMFAMVGPPRSSKGTIARVLRTLLGEDAVIGLQLSDLEKEFGIAPIVGKSVAIVGDSRIGNRTNQAAVVQNLLSISGEDKLSVNRKNKDHVNVQLRARVLLLSNELPALFDTSGALASRFVILQTRESFLGREDLGLFDRIVVDLPGILKWALDGYRDLLEAGRFIVPVASNDAHQEIEELGSPIKLFLRERGLVAADAWIECGALFEQWKSWCERTNNKPGTAQLFGRELKAAEPQIRTVEERLKDGTRGRARFYRGISLDPLAAAGPGGGA